MKSPKKRYPVDGKSIAFGLSVMLGACLLGWVIGVLFPEFQGFTR